MQQQILSRSRLEPIIRQFNLYPQDVNRRSMDELVARLQRTIEVTPIAPMSETRTQQLPGFYIAVTLDNARNAQEVCTAVTSLFIEQNLRLATRAFRSNDEVPVARAGQRQGKFG